MKFEIDFNYNDHTITYTKYDYKLYTFIYNIHNSTGPAVVGGADNLNDWYLYDENVNDFNIFISVMRMKNIIELYIIEKQKQYLFA